MTSHAPHIKLMMMIYQRIMKITQMQQPITKQFLVEQIVASCDTVVNENKQNVRLLPTFSHILLQDKIWNIDVLFCLRDEKIPLQVHLLDEKSDRLIDEFWRNVYKNDELCKNYSDVDNAYNIIVTNQEFIPQGLGHYREDSLVEGWSTPNFVFMQSDQFIYMKSKHVVHWMRIDDNYQLLIMHSTKESTNDVSIF